MTYLKNSIIKHTDRDDLDNYIAPDYYSLNTAGIESLLDDLDESYFDYVNIKDNQNIEKIASDIYGDANYWDLLMLINKRAPLFDNVVDYDTIIALTDSKILDYQKNVYKKTLTQSEYLVMFNAVKQSYLEQNDQNRVLKYIKPAYIRKFLKDCHKKGLLN